MTEDGSTSGLEAELAQAKRDEEWALIRLIGWLGLLAFIVVVLLLSPWPWGALVGLAFWLLGFRGVYASFSAAVTRARELQQQAGQSVEPN